MIEKDEELMFDSLIGTIVSYFITLVGHLIPSQILFFMGAACEFICIMIMAVVFISREGNKDEIEDEQDQQ